MNPTTTAPSMTGDELVASCKRHTIYEWSAQTAVDPIPVARAEGVYFWTPEGKRYLDFNSQLAATSRKAAGVKSGWKRSAWKPSCRS